MHLTSYHSQTTTKACANCGAPFIGHPRREYCSPRCKRKAREFRYKTAPGTASPTSYFEREYGTVTPEFANSIFQWMTTSADGLGEAVSVKTFTAPDSTIIPPTLMARDNGKFIEVVKLHQQSDIKPESITITEELKRTHTPTMEELLREGGTFEIVP